MPALKAPNVSPGVPFCEKEIIGKADTSVSIKEKYMCFMRLFKV
jgi:hypothetical protein